MDQSDVVLHDKELSDRFDGRLVLRRWELIRLGETFAKRVVADGRLVHPSLPGGDPEQGIYVFAGIEDHPDLPEALVSVMTNGVLCRRHVAVRHGLTADLVDRLDVYVRASATVRDRSFYRAVRTRNPEHLTIGVETLPNALGVEVLATGKARTVVDLLRAMRRDGEEFRQGVEALGAFVAQGGDTAELVEMASRFESWLPRVLDAVVEGRSDGWSPS